MEETKEIQTMSREMKAKTFLSMTPEMFDQYMCQTYPRLFRDRTKPMNQTCMCWGFSIGKGWYKLLDKLCYKISVLQKDHKFEIIFDQVKEKFGTARFYWHGEGNGEEINAEEQDLVDIISSLFNYYESKTEHTCAECGEYHGHEKISICGWIYDVCEDCFEKVMPERKEGLEYWKKTNELRSVLENILFYCDGDELENIYKEISKKHEEIMKKIMKKNA